MPFWENIMLTQKVYPDRYGNVPTSFMRRVRRNVTDLVTGLSDTSEAKRKRGARASGKWPGMWSGQIKLKGEYVQAIIARPPRKAVGSKADKSRKFMSSTRGVVQTRRVVETDVPRILFIRPPEAHYEPILQKPWEDSLAKAMTTLPARLEYELMRKRRRSEDRDGVGGRAKMREYNSLRYGKVYDSTES